MVTVNLFGDHPSFVRNMKHLKTPSTAGDRVARSARRQSVALAFSGPALDVPFTTLAGVRNTSS